MPPPQKNTRRDRKALKTLNKNVIRHQELGQESHRQGGYLIDTRGVKLAQTSRVLSGADFPRDLGLRMDGMAAIW